MSSSNPNYSKVFLLLSGICFVILLDAFFFKFGLWILPNESSWGSDYFYNFLQEYKSMGAKKKEKFRLLLLGSSVTHYSLNQKDLASEISKLSGKEVDVEILSYGGMAPLDAYLLREKIADLDPDLILYPVNFVDWRLYRTYVLEPETGKNETIAEDKLLRDAFDWSDAPQSRFLFPWETVSEFWNILGIEKDAELLAASLFGSYRYKGIYWKILSSLWEHRFGRNSSYREYNGVQIPERVTSRGWTGKNFSFFPKEYMARRGFYIQIVEEILQEGELKLEFRNSSGVSQSFEFSSPGWKKILLDPRFLKEGSEDPDALVKAELSNTWTPYEAGPEHKDWILDRLGVRLQQTFGEEGSRQGMQFTREERTEDLRYLGMSEKEYAEYFQFRIFADPKLRPGTQYLRVLADAKKRIATESFRPVLHFRYMKELLQFLRERRVPVLLINNPENPISLSWYEKSSWYKEHLDYLRTISGGDNFFLDWKDELRPTDFWDFHHFTYQAMTKMNSKYAQAVLKFVE
ncbi:hypothetical protein EHQ53_14790 [Leptospira langatensis]|uniref:Uncharacterized protein n=1 Tax=Leptospira langatensis TaxID=2484983 RepID=A0A5F1ZQ94_9LEPT|nr:hypothetical protein [Leptospira langatensis]TGK01746.1 hypothetical protein EHO57_08030 [Leptospira langatensis]TGL39352.1 hypothetical protein EHQ53_14790 [Leptospira langatensis]